MMKGIPSRFPVVLWALANALCPQLIGEIDSEATALFDRYADAIGGREAYEGIESARIRMTMEIPSQGMSMQMKVTYLAPDKIHMDVVIPGMGGMTQGFDGEKGWSIDLIQGSRELKGAELAKLKADTDFKEGVKLAEKYASASVTGVSEDGLIVVKAVTLENGQEETLYFERESGLLRMSDMTEDLGPQGEVPVTERVTLYEAYGKLLLPSVLEADMMGMRMNMRLESFEANVEVDPSIFRMPE